MLSEASCLIPSHLGGPAPTTPIVCLAMQCTTTIACMECRVLYEGAKFLQVYCMYSLIAAFAEEASTTQMSDYYGDYLSEETHM